MGKQFILANIDEAIRLVTEQPEALLYLETYEQKTDCGTLYCAAGLLTTSAHFRNLGWSLYRGEHGDRYAWVHINGREITNERAEPYFGPTASRNLFSAAGGSAFDCDFEGYFNDEGDTGEGHKALALHRLRTQRALVEAM